MSSTHAVVEMSEIKADLKDSKQVSSKKVDDSAAKTCDITEHALPHDKLAAFLQTDLEEGLTAQGQYMYDIVSVCTILEILVYGAM